MKKKKTEVERVRESAKTVYKERSKYKEALVRISKMGTGIRSDMIDWVSVGMNSTHVAREAVSEKCPICGKTL